MKYRIIWISPPPPLENINPPKSQMQTPSDSHLESMSVVVLLSLCMKPWCVTIQLKAIEQYFHVVLFVFENFVKRNSRIFPQFLT